MSELEGSRILVVDDDIHLLHMMEAILSRSGAEVHTAQDGVQALQLLTDCSPELVILDVMMPGMNGFELSAEIQRRIRVPIIFLTALGDDRDIVRGLEGGAVDYVTKPVSREVLIARVRAALRQAVRADRAEAPARYDDGDLTIDQAARRVFMRGRAVQLTPLEWKLLLCLFESAGRVVPHDEILEKVWGPAYQDSINYVHVYVSALRQKLELDPSQPRYIHTDRGIGYRFDRPVD